MSSLPPHARHRKRVAEARWKRKGPAPFFPSLPTCCAARLASATLPSGRNRAAASFEKASLRREPTADRMRPMMVFDCPMKAFTNRFSGVPVVGLILRSDTISGRLPARAFGEPRCRWRE